MLLPELYNWEGILGICTDEYTEKRLVATFFRGKKRSYDETINGGLVHKLWSYPVL